MCSANNQPKELLSGDDLTKYVKDLIMTDKFKRSESYYQSKLVTINIQKIMQNLTQGGLFYIKGGGASQKSSGRPEH